MKKILNFFENLNEFVYAVDIDTYELIYMNRKMRESYGFHSNTELIGKKCYEVVNRCSVPCAICNTDDLAVGSFMECRHYNPVLGKFLALKDTLLEKNGKCYRVEIAMDVSREEMNNQMLRSYHNLETFANEGIRLALQTSTPDQAIDVILEYLGKALKSERTYVFEQNEQGGDDNTYEWVASGIRPQKENLQNVPPEVCANWYQRFREGRSIIIEKLEDIREEEPLQYEILKNQDIDSLTVVPLYDDKRILGFYGVDNPHIEYFQDANNMLQVMGYFIISCLKRRELLKQLETMSYMDQLTGIGNRHAMYKYIEGMQLGGGKTSIGIVYCDITGLKRVNDTEGHEAGDRLICRACASLKNVFGSYGLFRIGGDELLALCPQIKETEFGEKTESLRKDMLENSVNMAVGTAWSDKNTDIRELMSRAEKQMYQDKSEYYKRSGLDRRR